MFTELPSRARNARRSSRHRKLHFDELESREYPNLMFFGLPDVLPQSSVTQALDSLRGVGRERNGSSSVPGALPALDKSATAPPTSKGAPFYGVQGATAESRTASSFASDAVLTAMTDGHPSRAVVPSATTGPAAASAVDEHSHAAWDGAAGDDHTHPPMTRDLLMDSGPVGAGDNQAPPASHHVSFRNGPTGFHDMLSNMIRYRIEESYGGLTMPQDLVLGIERALATWRNFGAPFEVQEAQPGGGADFVLLPSNACNDPTAPACTNSTVGPLTGYLVDQHHWHRWLPGTVEVRFVQQGMIWVDDPNDKPNGHPEETQQNDYDAETAALHELGHVLGLDHDPAGSGTVMEPVYQGARRVPSEFHRYDVGHLYHDPACPALPCW